MEKRKKTPKEINSTTSWDLFVQQVGFDFKLGGLKLFD